MFLIKDYENLDLPINLKKISEEIIKNAESETKKRGKILTLTIYCIRK